jgi:hypothetical protein
MLQAHSFLWYYLWVAPDLILLILAILIWRRGLHKQYPVFLVFAVVIAVEQLTLCVTDVLPSVSPTTWWYLFWAGLLAEALVKFALIGEIFSAVFGMYPSLAKLGKLLISGVGVVLVLLATVAAAYTPKDNTYWIVSGAHLLEQTIYMIQCGLVLVPLRVCGLLQTAVEPLRLRHRTRVGRLGVCTSCDLGADGQREFLRSTIAFSSIF